MHAHRPTTAPDPRRWWILGLLAIAQAMLVIDVTVVNVALPSIGAELGLDRAALTWVVTAYTLFFGSLLLLGGRLADGYGRRRMFLIGIGTFVVASLASGLAPDGTILVAARAAQGIGAALMSPAALSIVRWSRWSSSTTSNKIFASVNSYPQPPSVEGVVARRRSIFLAQ